MNRCVRHFELFDHWGFGLSSGIPGKVATSQLRTVSLPKRLSRLGELQLLLATLACTASCGGGGGGSGPQPPTVVSESTSPWVAQHRWYGEYGDVSQAAVFVDGAASTIDRVRSSDFVRVKGTFTLRRYSDGHTEDTFFRLTSVVDDATVIGPVDSADLQHRRLVVLNQPVSFLAIDTDECATCDADAGLPSVEVGDVVRISGFVSDDGSILANRIDPATTSTQVRVEGTVRSLDAGSRRFFYQWSGDRLPGGIGGGSFRSSTRRPPRAGHWRSADIAQSRGGNPDQ